MGMDWRRLRQQVAQPDRRNIPFSEGCDSLAAIVFTEWG
jgi:hypothetical protein